MKFFMNLFFFNNGNAFISIFLLLFSMGTAFAQICSSYVLKPDTVLINTTHTFEIQPSTGGTTPPSLWVCNWLDFEANGTHECLNIPSCSYTFTTGGLRPVTYQINEPFLGNTEVCTSYVYVNNCNAGVSAKANNTAVALGICENSGVQFKAALSDSTTCPGTWLYAWSNGNFFYDGSDFLSFTEVWNQSFKIINYNNITDTKTYKLKTKCSVFSACKDSSSVTVYVKQNIETPFFAPLSNTVRCMGTDTILMEATAAHADSIIYSIDQASVNAGNAINAHTGILIFDALFHGTTTVTAVAYGCDGPKTTFHTIITHPLPNAIFASDTTYMCMGDTLNLPFNLTGTSPFVIIYEDESQTVSHFITPSHTGFFPVPIDSAYMFLNFLNIQDNFCLRYLNINHHVFASEKPVFIPLTDTTICAEESILFDVGQGPYQYFWPHNSAVTNAVLIDTSLMAVELGINYISVYITNDYCVIADTAIITFSLCALNKIHAVEPAFFEIFPNPAKENFSIVLNFNFKTAVLEIYSVSGKLLFKERINTIANNAFNLSIKEKGAFIIKLSVDGFEPVSKKLILY